MKLPFLLLLAWPMFLGASELPPKVLPMGVGVNIHFTSGREKDLDLIAAGGFRFVRMDFAWESIEHERGKYDWSAYDALSRDLEQRGMRAIYILDYSHPLYEHEVTAKNPITGKEEEATLASPQHAESIAAFARFAGAAAEHFRGRQVVWEIWNEPNIGFWKPKPDANQYAELALATAKAVKAADPGSTLIGPASSGLPWEFLETVFKAGVLNYLDAVSVHPYRAPDQSPETAREEFHKLARMIDRYAPTERRGQIPIISGEWGYSTCTSGVTEEQQAAYLVRQQLSNLLNEIPLSIWYDWKNDGRDAKENEHNFGTVREDLSPKPAYVAIKTMTAQLAGYHIERRWTIGDESDYVLVLSDDKGQTKLAAWTTGKAHGITLRLNRGGGAITAVDGRGGALPIGAQNKLISVPVTGLPVYVNLGKIRPAIDRKVN